MKKLSCMFLMALLPLVGLAQETKEAPKAPKQNTLSTYRVWVKDGHTEAFKAAVANHAQKFHTGNWKWRVSEVITGPDSGAYMINEGPNSWTDIDGRGTLGPEHDKDYATNILPHTEKSSPEMFVVYEADASTTAATNWSTKAGITHYFYKPGRGPATFAWLKSLKPVIEKIGGNVVVWSTAFSGEGQFILVRRFKDGLKDMDLDTPSVRKTYDEIHGPGSYERALEDMGRNLSHVYSELIEAKPELSSK
jgi:hypothetical protein